MINYKQFIGKQVNYNDIIFTLKDIEINKDFWCDNSCWKFKSNDCSYKKTIDFKNRSNKFFYNKITLTIENKSLNTYHFTYNSFFTTCESHKEYKAILPCDTLYQDDFQEYYDTTILPSIKLEISLYFTHAINFSNIIALYYKDYNGYKFGFDFCLNDNNSFIKIQENALLLQELQKLNQLFNYLEESIERRLTNKLFRNQKASYENQILNEKCRIEKAINNANLSNDEKNNQLNKLNDIMQTYFSQLQKIGETPQTLWEKQGNEGIRQDLGETVFRSSWEANIARVLNYKKILFEYEKERLELSEELSYLPDFFLQNNGYIEVKGMWDNESLEKVDSFIRMFPDKKLYIIDQDNYFEINKIYTNYQPLPYWEKSNCSLRSENVAIVGMRFLKDQTVLNEISVGDKLFLELEPNNPYDKFAIIVKTMNGKNLGHIEKKFASIYSQKIKNGMIFDIEIISIEPKVIKVKITRNNLEDCTLPVILQNNE